MQPASFWKGHRHRRAGAIETGARSAIGVPMDEVYQGGFVSEGRRNFLTTPAFEDEAGLGAVDTHLFHVWVCEVFRQRAQRCHRGKDPPQKLFGFLAQHRRHGSALLFGDYTSDQLTNPRLVVDAHAREAASCQLGRELGLDARPSLLLDHNAIACGYCHLETAKGASG